MRSGLLVLAPAALLLAACESPTPVGDARAELFQTGPETYLLQSGEGLYAIDLAACDAQAVEAPAQGIAGTPVGAFDRKDGRLRFVAAPPPG